MLLRLTGILLSASLIAASAMAAEPSLEPPAYHLLTSDVMTSMVQPRHIKLWLAGQNADWAYAEYERRNLQGVFRRWAAAIPDYRGQKVADLVAAFTDEPFARLEAAIKAKDGAAFTEAYGTLTDGCNNCHRSAGQELVVIKVPSGNPFPDQDFPPSTR
jgi:hypothetical protein